MKAKVNDVVVWRRRQRGGMRRHTDIVVAVRSETPAGRYVVVYERYGREVTAVVEPSSLLSKAEAEAKPV